MQTTKVKHDEDGQRLDRWFKKHYPQVTHGVLQKMLRGKFIKVGGKKATADQRLVAGDEIKHPEIKEEKKEEKAGKTKFYRENVSEKDKEFVQSLVIYKNDDVIAINKPQGLAVQGGSNVTYHLDMLLGGLKFEKEEMPRLVHRLDKETSGVLVLARTAKAASYMARIFKERDTKKIYWALVKGTPKTKNGKISLPIAKTIGKDGFEKMRVEFGDEGLRATTYYRVVEEAGNEYSFVELCPISGRTHQLRIHMAELGHPIVGDDKYFPRELLKSRSLPDKLHLHAKALIFKGPDGKNICLEAPLPEHFVRSFEILGFEYKNMGNSFKSFDEVLR